MNILPDTHAFMWFVNGDPMLGKAAKDAIENLENKALMSVASLWEIAVKVNIGKLSLSRPYTEIKDRMEENFIELLPITFDHTVLLTDLPLHHRDPFDRLIIAQAMTGKMTVLTKDENFNHYPIDIIW